MSLFLLPIEPKSDYYNHVNWGIGFENGLFPYKDYAFNEYPVLSVWGWIITYKLSPSKSYFWLSTIMNLPYWILAVFGGIAFYYLLVDYGIDDRKAVYLVSFFFFLPLNMIDTINNHGSLGTSSTVIIAVYLWHKKKYFWSSVFIGAGFSIKLYPIFIAPFLIMSINKFRGKIKYSIYLFFWIIIFHIPVLFIFQDYIAVLFARTKTRKGLSFSKPLEIIASPFGLDAFPTIVWLIAIMLTTLILILEYDLSLLEKFTIILMVNNLLEPRGGIGHIVTVLPIFAIYFLVESKNKNEKFGFWVYIFLLTLYGSDRFLFEFRENMYVRGISNTIIMIFTVTILFVYLRRLKEFNKFHLVFKRYLQ